MTLTTQGAGRLVVAITGATGPANHSPTWWTDWPRLPVIRELLDAATK